VFSGSLDGAFIDDCCALLCRYYVMLCFVIMHLICVTWEPQHWDEYHEKSGELSGNFTMPGGWSPCVSAWLLLCWNRSNYRRIRLKVNFIVVIFC